MLEAEANTIHVPVPFTTPHLRQALPCIGQKNPESMSHVDSGMFLLKL
jgi:hypothetical protein